MKARHSFCLIHQVLRQPKAQDRENAGDTVEDTQYDKSMSDNDSKDNGDNGVDNVDGPPNDGDQSDDGDEVDADGDENDTDTDGSDSDDLNDLTTPSSRIALSTKVTCMFLFPSLYHADRHYKVPRPPLEIFLSRSNNLLVVLLN